MLGDKLHLKKIQKKKKKSLQQNIFPNPENRQKSRKHKEADGK